MKYGIFTNPSKDVGLVATRRVADALKKAGCHIYYDAQTASELGIKEYSDARHCDVLLIIGGDGTILRAANKYIRYGIFLAGINCGHLGFMSEINIDDVTEFISRVEDGAFIIDERMVLEGEVNSSGKKIYALNDFIIVRKNVTRMMHMELYVNNSCVQEYSGDGIILATPTGSTAYSLSAGGPIISPNVNCILITPICPHSLYTRSIAIKYSDIVKVRPFKHEGGIVLSGDGQYDVELFEGDIVTARMSTVKAKFIRLKSDAFFPQLKAKLAQWNTIE